MARPCNAGKTSRNVSHRCPNGLPEWNVYIQLICSSWVSLSSHMVGFWVLSTSETCAQPWCCECWGQRKATFLFNESWPLGSGPSLDMRVPVVIKKTTSHPNCFWSNLTTNYCMLFYCIGFSSIVPTWSHHLRSSHGIHNPRGTDGRFCYVYCSFSAADADSRGRPFVLGGLGRLGGFS